ncbi:MAG: hypothetical protein JXO72_01720 [Vicinamibacteria bacterium]|nr:hypothetical protein [Vicinamibacteria bacterium]
MQEIVTLDQSIRQIFRDAELRERIFHGREADRFRLIAAMDTLSDTTQALHHFERMAPQLFGGERPEAQGPRYLHSYGVFTAITLQQNALETVWRSLLEIPLNTETCEQWRQLREWHELLVDPDSQKDENGVPPITRMNVDPSGIEIFIWSGEARGRVHIDLLASFRGYKAELKQILESLQDTLRTRWLGDGV